MNVIEAINGRHSTRAFLPKPVELRKAPEPKQSKMLALIEKYRLTYGKSVC
jgi:nitroreductase